MTQMQTFAAVLGLCSSLGFPIGNAFAGLIVEIVPGTTNVASGVAQSGTFEVLLNNPASSSQVFSLEGFQFELRSPSGSGVLFAGATSATVSANYVFLGNSVADSFFGGDLVVSSPPPPATNDLVAFDSVVIPNSFTVLNPGDTVGLGLISFTVAANAPVGVVRLSVVAFDATAEPSGTQLVDPDLPLTSVPVAMRVMG